ncbi:MAG: DUF4236 domain-containing protein [Alphaproteobacteria bacterium]|nr:DUF4236 domain-containing protein [Alphaproteobacteria bacterium]
MGFYLRKSIKAGPFRFNLSKSGIGVSTGIKGLRLGTGPRGNYIHMGRGGFYYRKTFGNNSSASPSTARAPVSNANNTPPPQQAPDNSGYGPFTDIDSGDVSAMTDSSSAELLAEFDSKQKKITLYPFVIAATILILWFLPEGVERWITGTVLALGAIGTYFAYNYDQYRKSVVLFYDVEGPYESAYQGLHDAFTALTSTKKAWHVESQADIYDRKRHAGASLAIKRQDIRLSMAAAPYVKTNISVPSIKVGKQTLFFFPDRLLVFDKKKVGAVSYSDLNIKVSSARFIEEGSVPRDAQIVGQTWKYVNKKGGPDRRFNNNHEIPICLYEEILFSSSTGLNEMVQLSKCGLGNHFRASIETLARVSF